MGGRSERFGEVGRSNQLLPQTLALLRGAPINCLMARLGSVVRGCLPVLAGVFGYKARQALALKLATLITAVSALLICGGTLSTVTLVALLPGATAAVAGRSWPRTSA